MVYNDKMLFNKRFLPKAIKVGLPDGNFKLVKTVGSVKLSDTLILHNVMLVEGFKHNLLSVSKLSEHSNVKVCFNKINCWFQDLTNGWLVGQGVKEAGLYYYHAHKHSMQNTNSDDKVDTSIREVHCIHTVLPNKTATSIDNKPRKNIDIHVLLARLGHLSLSKMNHIPICDCSGLTEYNCDICNCSKFHKMPFNISVYRANQSFDLIHIDLWGAYKTPALGGAKYFVTILDDYSRVTWTFLIGNKMQVGKVISDYLAMVYNQFGAKVKTIRSDNGTELIKEQCTRLFAEKGIIHQRSVPKVPQQNSRVERKHKHLLEVSRALRFHANLPKKF
ncbi:Retrovirus-related Pol polyprotein from transposon TNT 1-94 [Bienertia sinuspersici]